MSFKQIASDVSICNMALGRIGESNMLSSLDDSGHNATVANRWYKKVVAKLLETHHWNLATKRATPVAITNDRAAEWGYAFAAPDDMAFPVVFSLFNGASSVSYYRGLGGLVAKLYGRPIFQFHNGTLYSNYDGDLEYVSYDITEADFTETFESIVVLSLASVFALEIPKDKELSDDLKAEALNEINVAIAHNLNAGNRSYGDTPSEAELVRGSLAGSNWDWFPRAPGT